MREPGRKGGGKEPGKEIKRREYTDSHPTYENDLYIQIPNMINSEMSTPNTS